MGRGLQCDNVHHLGGRLGTRPLAPCKCRHGVYTPCAAGAVLSRGAQRAIETIVSQRGEDGYVSRRDRPLPSGAKIQPHQGCDTWASGLGLFPHKSMAIIYKPAESAAISLPPSTLTFPFPHCLLAACRRRRRQQFGRLRRAPSPCSRQRPRRRRVWLAAGPVDERRLAGGPAAPAR